MKDQRDYIKYVLGTHILDADQLTVCKGLAIPLLGSVVENSALFFFFGQFLNVFNAFGPPTQMTGGQELRSLPKSVLSGFCSGVCVSFLLTPIELVKCKLQIQDGVRERRYAGPLDCMRKVVRQHGITGMYTGHSVTALRESFGCAAWFGIYETSCRLLAKPGQSRTDLSAVQHVTAGALAGIAYNAALFPADVIKSQVQTAEGAEKQYGYARTVSRLYNAEGIRGFYRGLGVTLARAVPANMVIFGTYVG